MSASQPALCLATHESSADVGSLTHSFEDAATPIPTPVDNKDGEDRKSPNSTSEMNSSPFVMKINGVSAADDTPDQPDGQLAEPTQEEDILHTIHQDKLRNFPKRKVVDGEEPELKDNSHDDYDEEDLVRYKDEISDFVTYPELYDIYVQKLEKLRQKAGAPKDKDRTPGLIRSVVDYLSSSDERMRKLEDKVGIVSKDKAVKDSDASDVGGTEFYNVDDFGDAGVEASNDEEDEWNVEGAFCSTIDAVQRIRALFKWKGKTNSKTTETQLPPDPLSVEILEIRIKSKPIAVFFEKELNYNISQDGLIHLVKPFRFLIRKVDLIRDHVGRLEAQYKGISRATSLPMVFEDEDVGDAPGSHQRALTTSTADASDPDFLESKEALEHFKELLKFADTYLAVDISRFQEYRNGTRPTVNFDNLWMLFDSADTIYCPVKKGECKIYDEQDKDYQFMWTQEVQAPQVYRVLATLGGIARNPTTPVDSQFGKRQKKSTLSQVNTIQQGTIQKHMREKCTSLYIDCYFIGFDGVQFRAVADSFELKPFQGELPVTSLEVYPICYYSKIKENGLSDLIQRGCHYIELTSVQHVSHKGLTVGEHKEEINGPVIVDFKSAYQHEDKWKPALTPTHAIKWLWDQKSVLEIQKRTCSHKRCHKTSCIEDVAIAQQKGCLDKGFRDINILLDDYGVESKEALEKFKDDMKSHNLLQLLPGTAHAFSLRNRKWVKVALRNLGTVKYEDNWDDLVLPDGHKSMVQAMVEMHTSSSSALDSAKGRYDYEVDLVPGKGKGCIILLHGEPGVGKTSTAECVAAFTKRPLYPITCGDIGVTPKDVETSLDLHFTRAHKWGCVLLLDEADVFLAKRNKIGDDIQRNGLVSVFLRTLEYYSGILFLTTNRVGSFDDAFRSRIHVQLHYPKLTEPQAVKIWKTNISRLERHNNDRRNKNLPEVEINRKRILKFAKANFDAFHWNGRQIRNAFQTAIALAEFEARPKDGKSPKVTTKHFDKVATATTEFDDYLKEVHGFDEDKIARRDHERVTYTPKPRKTKLTAESEDSDSSGSSDTSDDESEEEDSDDTDSPTEAKSKRVKKKKEKENEEKKKKRKKEKSAKSKD